MNARTLQRPRPRRLPIENESPWSPRIPLMLRPLARSSARRLGNEREFPRVLDDGEAATCERNAAAISAAYLFAPDRLDIIAPGLLRDSRARAREFSPLHCCEDRA